MNTTSSRARGASLARKLVAAYIGTIVVVFGVMGIVLDRNLESAFVEDLTRSLETSARAIRAALPSESLQSSVRRLGDELGVRITVIRADGTVVADSREDPAAIENHSARPEVRAALSGKVGIATRLSATVGEPYRYVALPPRDERIVRVALPLASVRARVGRVRAIVATGFGVGAIVGFVALWLAAKRLTRPLDRISAGAAALAAGDLRTRIEPEGSSELTLLAGTLNRMAEALGAQIEEVERDRQMREAILASMTEGVVLVEAKDVVRYANPAADRLGASSGPDRLRAALSAVVDRSRTTGSIEEEELSSGPSALTLWASAIPLEGDLVLLVLRDVTEVRRIEAIRRDFVTAASHELKTPVASIQATAETVQRALDEDPEAAKRFAGQLLRESQRLAELVMDLLDLSRLESERPVMEPVRLDGLASEEADRIRERAESAGLRIETRFDPVTINGSRKDLALLVSNLLDNAIRYTGESGTVSLDVRAHDGSAVLRVTDTGIGIASRELPRIFERFYRVDRARSRVTGGTGLGLAIVKHVAEQHGGTVEAESELGRGSTFTVRVPAS